LYLAPGTLLDKGKEQELHPARFTNDELPRFSYEFDSLTFVCYIRGEFFHPEFNKFFQVHDDCGVIQDQVFSRAQKLFLAFFSLAAGLFPEFQGAATGLATQVSFRSRDSLASAKNTKVAPAALAKYRLAESLLQQGKPTEAAEALDAAIQLQTDFVEAHFALGVILARQGEKSYGAAIDHFLEVIRLDPKHVDARVNLSNLLEQDGEFEAAAAAMKEAVALADGQANLYVMLGRRQGQAEKYREAIESFHRALKLDPQVPGAHYGLAMTLRSQGDLSAAQSEFELALKLNPDDALAHYQLGRFLIQQKRPVEASHHLQEAVRLKPELADAYAKLGVLYRSLNKNDEAEKALRTAVRLNPKLGKAQYGLAQLLQAKGETEEAQKLFEQVREAKASSSALNQASTLNLRGVTLMKAGRLDEALGNFRNALKLDPSLASASYNQGLVLAQQGKTTEAIECFRTAIRLRPGFALAHYGLGLALHLAGDPAAEEQLRKAELMKGFMPLKGDRNRTVTLEDPD
jgi:tetratricopeptide (TPR) repeat protein